MNIVPYTGKKQDLSYVFEEEIQRILKEKNRNIFSKEQFLQLIDSIESNIENKHQLILNTIKDLPSNQKHFSTIVKNILTSDGRSKVLFDKTSNFNNKYDIENMEEEKEVIFDPRKSTITMSKLLRSGNNFMSPLFKVVTDTSITRKNTNITIGKLLLEIRISTPLGNLKGYITSGFLNNKYGIGFFSEYNYSVDTQKMYIIAHKTDSTPDNVVEFSIIRLENENANPQYEDYIPMNISITPLITGEANITDINNTDIDIIRLNQSLIQDSSLPENNSYIYGCGDFSINGHGPIDCEIKEFDNNNIDFSTITKIIPKYYPGNKGKIQCISPVPIKDKIKSKLLSVRIQPSTFESTTELSDSHILKPPFGKSHFDMYNLLKTIYNFTNMKAYKCIGNIIINGIVIPVIGFVINNIGRVTFTISPFFIIPDELKSINGIDNEYRGLRRPLIIFDTNRVVAHTYENNGFIGDIDNENGKFSMGFDSQRKSYKKTAEYSLSLIDIIIEIPDCTGILNGIKENVGFRYSGDFNKYNYDFTKFDSDSYPYPGEERDISDRLNEIDEIPALRPESLILATSDNQYVFVWVDNEEEYFSYSTTVNNN